MLGPTDYLLWFLTGFLEAGVVVCAFRAKCLGRYFTLGVYMAAAFLLTAGRYIVFLHFGFRSDQYLYFYYYSDALLTICLYFALMGLYFQVFGEMGASTYLRVAAMLLLAGTALISYFIIDSSRDRMITRFVVELSQNLYFVGVVLTYLLWGAMLKLHETRTRLIQLVLALGVYFSVFAANFALRNMYPTLILWKYIPPVMAVWLPVAWSYTFLKIPEEARLVTARLAATRSR